MDSIRTMDGYVEPKPNEGRIRPNDPGENPNRPIMRGYVLVTEPGLYKISGWGKTDDRGRYLSIALTYDSPVQSPNGDQPAGAEQEAWF